MQFKFFLQKYDLKEWSDINRPSDDRILLYYFITDYISCGLSSPVYHTEFHKNLHSDKSKMKLLKEIITIWDVLFKRYTVTSMYLCNNIDIVLIFDTSMYYRIMVICRSKC